MNPNRANATAWNEASDRRGRSPDGWSTVTGFFRRQPEFVLGSAVVGGALLAFWLKKGASAPGGSVMTGDGGAQAAAWAMTAARPAPDQRRGRHERRSWARDNEGPRRMPSARLGATEDQMEDLATPSTHALETGTSGATGAAYDLDPNSITGG